MGGYVDPMLGVAARVAQLETNMPVASTELPNSESTSPSAGDNLQKFSQEKHVHPRLSSASYTTTNGAGVGTLVFTRVFATKPCPIFTADNNSGVTATVTGWTQDGNGNYTGCTFFASKRTAGSSLVTAVVALVTVVTGVTTTNTDTPVPNQLMSVIMLQQS